MAAEDMTYQIRCIAKLRAGVVSINTRIDITLLTKIKLVLLRRLELLLWIVWKLLIPLLSNIPVLIVVILVELRENYYNAECL